jgi:hypothetical protein
MPTSNRCMYTDRIGVGVIERYINPSVCRLSDDSHEAPLDYDFCENDHGTHVANTLKAICPYIRIYNYAESGERAGLFDSLNKMAKNDEIDIINISRGPSDLSCLDAWKPKGSIYNALLTATKKGKIIVKSFGNDFGTEDHDEYVDAYIEISKDRAMMGRMILVLNSEYSKNTDKLHHSSNRPEDHFRRAITAPGTDITALTDINTFTTKTGTSMATPIVTGVLAQLLHDFQERREFFVEHDLCMHNAFKGIIIKGVLDNARKFGLNGEKLGPTFGQGIVDYQSAYHKIQDEFDRIFFEKKNDLTVDIVRNGLKIQSNEINREIENRRRRLDDKRHEIASEIGFNSQLKEMNRKMEKDKREIENMKRELEMLKREKERERLEKEKKKREEERETEEFENRTRLKLISDARKELELIQRHLLRNQEYENMRPEKEREQKEPEDRLRLTLINKAEKELELINRHILRNQEYENMKREKEKAEHKKEKKKTELEPDFEELRREIQKKRNKFEEMKHQTRRERG